MPGIYQLKLVPPPPPQWKYPFPSIYIFPVLYWWGGGSSLCGCRCLLLSLYGAFYVIEWSCCIGDGCDISVCSMCIFIMHPVVLVLAGMSAGVLNVPEGCGGYRHNQESYICCIICVRLSLQLLSPSALRPWYLYREIMHSNVMVW